MPSFHLLFSIYTLVGVPVLSAMQATWGTRVNLLGCQPTLVGNGWLQLVHRMIPSRQCLQSDS